MVVRRHAELPRSARTPGEARQAVRSWLSSSPRHAAALDDAVEIVSELVTNVVQHVPAGQRRDWVMVLLGLGDGFVRVEVVDAGTSDSEPRFVAVRQGSMELSGRGLGLVAALSVRRGTFLVDGGHRVVWADLSVDVPAMAVAPQR